MALFKIMRYAIRPLYTLSTRINVCQQIKIDVQPIHTGMVLAKKPGKAAGKAGAMVQKKEMEVETDPQKLLTYCCGANYLREGSDPKLKPDSEYPDWLWTLPLDKPPSLEELDPNTYQYWRRLRKMHLQRHARLRRFRQLK